VRVEKVYRPSGIYDLIFFPVNYTSETVLLLQSHMVILIEYCISIKEDHQASLNFAVLAGKWQKCTF